jgi:hypothetical protein
MCDPSICSDGRGVADIDPRPHHHFWVCAENNLRLFRSYPPADGKKTEQTMNFTTRRRFVPAGIGAAILPKLSSRGQARSSRSRICRRRVYIAPGPVTGRPGRRHRFPVATATK